MASETENIPTRKVAEWLSEIPELAKEAWLTWGTQAAPADRGGRSVPGSRCLADLDRIVTLGTSSDHEGLGILASWVRAVVDDMQEAGQSAALPPGTVRAACAWLTDHLDWLTGQRYQGEFAADIRALRASLRAITKRRDSPPWPCLTTGCRATMRLIDGALECDAGHQHPGVDRWRFHPSMPLSQLGAALNIPTATLRSWHARHKLPYDPAKTTDAEAYAWPWDALKQRYPDLVAMIETHDTEAA